MAHRKVKGLQWACQLAGRPKIIPLGRPRGVKALGLRYERALARAVPMAKHGLWFEFLDANGPGFCQPDLVIEGQEAVLVLEVKLSWVPDGHTQIEELYRPVLAACCKKPVYGVQVTRNLRPGMGAVTVVGSLQEAVAEAKAGRLVCWHWLGTEVVSVGGKKEKAYG